MDIITHRLMMVAAKKMVVTQLYTSSNTSDLSTYNYTSVQIGDENASRWIVVSSGSTGTANTSATSCTINAVSATLAVNARQTSGTNQSSAQVWYAKVPTGTSVTISLVYSGSQSGNAISVFSLIGDVNLGNVGSATSGSTLSTSSLTVPQNGFVIASLVMYTGNSGTTASWSPASLTPQTLYSTGGTGGKAQTAYGTTAGSYSVSATLSTGTVTSALAAAVFYEP